MGLLLLGLVVGFFAGVVVGRRNPPALATLTPDTAATTTPPPPLHAPATPPPVAGAAPAVGPSAVPGAGGGLPVAPAAPVAVPALNKYARKAGLTEADFMPSDDILRRMQLAWDSGVTLGQLDRMVGAETSNPALSARDDADDRLDRVLGRLEQARAGEGGATPMDDPQPDTSPPPVAPATPGPAPTTMTDALVRFEADGYGDDLHLTGRHVGCRTCGAEHSPEALEVDRVVRFEGPSDPADEAIVLGLRCPECGAKGALVSAFGPDADPELADAFVYLASKVRYG